jgi:hypothetical protein
MAPYTTGPVWCRRARDQPIIETLVIPFAMVVLDVLCQRAPEVPLPERNQSVEAVFLDRPHEALP